MNEGVNIFELPERAWAWLSRLIPALEFDAAAILTLITIVFVVLGLFCVGMLVREVVTHYELAPERRVRYLLRSLLPNTSWSTEDLERWAAQLSMSRRRVRSHVDRPAHAIRIRLTSGPAGPRYTIEGSRRLAPIMRDPVLPGVAATRIRRRGVVEPATHRRS